MKERVLGLLTCREWYNALTKMSSVSLNSMCSNRNIDKCNDGDQIFCKRRLRPGWGSMRNKGKLGQGIARKTNIFKSSLLNCTSMCEV